MIALAVVLIVLAFAGLVALLIWAAARDQAAYDRWYTDPRRVWNQRPDQ